MTDTQPVVDKPNADAPHPAEDGDAPEKMSVDDLLKQFEAETEPDEQPKPAKAPDIGVDDIKRAVTWADEERERTAASRATAAIAEAVKTVKGDLDIDDEFVEGVLHVRASKDKRFLRAFQDRSSKPEAWSKVLDAVGREVAAKAEKSPDPDLTNTRTAVRAAVRSAATRSSGDEPAPNFGKMTDAEFKTWERDNIK